MKTFAFIIVALLWVAGLYFSYIHMIGKTMKTQQKETPKIAETKKQMDEQRKKIEDLKRRQERLMDQRRTHIRENR
ncbi:MAG: hypothetical protein KAJ18_01585 [Candidatus Omnitrophica bacterium]|nr:hypothetical protein [Candidatus Omnitrophota bacterium]